MLEERTMKLHRGLSTLLLAIYLILAGLQAIFRLHFLGMEVVMGVCALGAGLLLLLRR